MPCNNPKVSIILPVYNGEKTLKSTLDSLVNQTFVDFELLVGIDGTTDASKAIAQNFNDSRIKIIEHPENLGLANNVNALIAVTNQESLFIAMAEQDDIYVPERIEWQVAILEKHLNVGLVSGIVEFKGVGGSTLFPGILVQGEQFPQYQDLFKYLYKYQLKVVNTCMMVRKQVHVDHGLIFRNTYGNFNVDWDYVMRFSLVSEIYGIPKKLVMMNRRLANSSVTSNKRAQHSASRKLLKDFKKEFPQLVSVRLYKNALKEHRKIELGHNSKEGIIIKSLYYFLLYFDVYFLKYVFNKIKNYFIK